MSDLEACLACLNTGVKLINLDLTGLRSDFNTLTGLETQPGTALPNYVCVECHSQIKRFNRFRTKTHIAHIALLQLIQENKEIGLEDIELLDRDDMGLSPMLSQWSSDRAHHEFVKQSFDEDRPGAFLNEIKYETISDDVKLDYEVSASNSFFEEVNFEGHDIKTPINTDMSEDDNCIIIVVDSDNDQNDETFNDFHNNAIEQENNITIEQDLLLRIENLLPLTPNEQKANVKVCKSKSEANFESLAAVKHYKSTNSANTSNKLEDCDEQNGLSTESEGRRTKIVKAAKNMEEIKSFQASIISILQSPEEQYAIIKDRQMSKNYIENTLKCSLCCKGFNTFQTYDKHLKRHDPIISGKFICDVCKMCFHTKQRLNNHITGFHMYKHYCQWCDYVSHYKPQAMSHYRWHKNYKYDCPHCDKTFVKSNSCFSHVRLKHPSSNLCNICGHSFVSDNGLYYHKRIAHTKEEIKKSENLKGAATTNNELYCEDCNIVFMSYEAFDVHLSSSKKHTPINESALQRRSHEPNRFYTHEIQNVGLTMSTICDECGKILPSDAQARKHYRTKHPGVDYLQRYMCDFCGYTTNLYASLQGHLRTHTKEKPFACEECDRRFSLQTNRDRHRVIHTGEKPYECTYCDRRFTQKNSVKLHMRTVHFKIPYPPWQKKNNKQQRPKPEDTSPRADESDNGRRRFGTGPR